MHLPELLRALSPAAEAEYVWRDSSGQVIGEGTAVEVQAVESTWYVVEGRTASGCRGSDTVRVEVGQQLAVEAVGDTVVCRGSSVQLAVGRAASDAEYVWYRGGEEIGRGAAVWVVADTAAVYVVHGVRGACEGWDTVVVGVYPQGEVRSQDQRVCRGEEVELTLEGSGVRCWWEDTAGVVLSQSCRYRVAPARTVRYVGVMEDSNGCRSSVEVQVVVDEPAVVEVWVEPAVVEVGAGQRAFIRVMARSSGVARLRGGVVRVRVPVGVADVEGGQLDGQWKEVALAVGDVTVGGAVQELGRVEIVGVAGGDRSGPVEVRFQGEGCFVVQVRGGEVERQDVCAEALVRVRLVEPVQVVQRNQEVEVRGSGVEEVRLYTVDGREVMRGSGRSLWVGELASGMYLVRIRRGDQWQTVVVLLGR